jgi:hypothetical protein
MKIAVCTLHINDWYEKIVKYSLKNKKIYCDKHGYDFITQGSNTLDKSIQVYDGKRECPWYKIKFIKYILNNYDYDIVVWIDADTHILKMERTLEYYIDTYMKNKDMLLGSENNYPVHTGVIFARNTPYTKSILDAVWNNKEYFEPHFHEQASISNLYTRNYLDIQQHITVLTPYLQHEFSAYWYMYPNDNIFIMHAARCAWDPEGFISTLDLFCPLKMDEETQEQFDKRMTWLNTPEISTKTVNSWKACNGARILSARNK